MNQLIEKHKLTNSQNKYLNELSLNLNKYSDKVLVNLTKIEELLKTGITALDFKNSGFDVGSIELFHGVGEYNLSCENLTLHKSFDENNYDFINIFTNWNDVISINTNLNRDEKKSRLYKTFRDAKTYEVEEVIFFKWICKLWHKKELYRYSLNANTLQNNSVEQFDLNRCTWVDFLSKQECEYNCS